MAAMLGRMPSGARTGQIIGLVLGAITFALAWALTVIGDTATSCEGKSGADQSACFTEHQLKVQAAVVPAVIGVGLMVVSTGFYVGGSIVRSRRDDVASTGVAPAGAGVPPQFSPPYGPQYAPRQAPGPQAGPPV